MVCCKILTIFKIWIPKEGNEIWLLDYAEAVGIVPNNWHRRNGKVTNDTFGNTLHIFARNNRLVFDIYLQGGSTPLCREFYINLIKPLHEVLYYGRQFGSNSSTFFGDRYCDDSSRICLNSLTLSDIQETCKNVKNPVIWDWNFNSIILLKIKTNLLYCLLEIYYLF